MTVYLQKFKVIYPGHKFNGKTLDFIIKNGKFTKIGKDLNPNKYNHILSKGCISPGWIDTGTHLTAPGFEYRDTMTSLLDTAAAGGFTDIVTLPNTQPTIDNSAALSSVLSLSRQHGVNIHALAAITQATLGSHLTEMHDLKSAGAIGYSDGTHSITDEGNLYRALLYAKALDTVVVNQPRVSSLATDWQMNEGDVNITLGLNGQATIVEDIGTNRDLSVNQYAQGKLLLHKLSSPKSVKAVQSDKSNSNVFTSVNYLHLIQNDKNLVTFNTNCKVDPPLRSDRDQIQLVKLFSTDKIDIICSDHQPLDQEVKLVEFDKAACGAIGLQTLFSAMNTYIDKFDLQTFVKCVAINPRKIFKIDLPIFEIGEEARVTLFDPKQTFTLNQQTNRSKSKNSPFWEVELKGKILGIFGNGQCYSEEF